MIVSDIVTSDCRYGDSCKFAREHMSDVSQFREEWLIIIDKILGSYKYSKKADIIQRVKYFLDYVKKYKKS